MLCVSIIRGTDTAELDVRQVVVGASSDDHEKCAEQIRRILQLTNDHALGIAKWLRTNASGSTLLLHEEAYSSSPRDNVALLMTFFDVADEGYPTITRLVTRKIEKPAYEITLHDITDPKRKKSVKPASEVSPNLKRGKRTRVE